MDALIFNNTEDRMLHPQAKLISDSQWGRFFNNQLAYAILPFMSAKDEELLSKLDSSLPEITLQNVAANEQRKRSIWLAIALSRDSIDFELLFDVAVKLGLQSPAVLELIGIWGDSNFLNYFISFLDKDELEVLIKKGNYNFFINAGIHGHINILNFLVEKFPELLNDMVAERSFSTFMYAAQWGQVAVLEYLLDTVPALAEEMMKSSGYAAFRLAVHHERIDVLRLFERRFPNLIPEMLKQNMGSCFASVTQNNSRAMMVFMLGYPAAFDYAEAREEHEAYKHYVRPFVDIGLITIHNQKMQHELLQSDTAFDLIDSKEVTFCFYYLRNLIRRNDPAVLGDIRFLLEIPVVKALVHADSAPEQLDELLKLAIHVGNKDAISLLLRPPSEKKGVFLSLLYALEQQQQNYLINFPEANEEAKEIISTLRNAAECFYDKPSTKESFKTFKDTCYDAFTKNNTKLNEHRVLFGAFFAAIKNFFVALKEYLFCEAPTTVRFFDSRTKSARLVETLEQDVDEHIEATLVN